MQLKPKEKVQYVVSKKHGSTINLVDDQKISD